MDCWEVVVGVFFFDFVCVKVVVVEWYFLLDCCYGFYVEMVNVEVVCEDGVDVVMIIIFNYLYFDCVKVFFEVGIDVLCDKLLMNELGEVEMFVELVCQSGCVFGVFYVMFCFLMIC